MTEVQSGEIRTTLRSIVNREDSVSQGSSTQKNNSV
jgi:hypothetical protein